MGELTKSQTAIVHVARRELGLDDDVYRDVLRSVTGRETLAECTKGEWLALMRRFESLGFHGTNHRPTPARRAQALVTPAQLDLLRELFVQLGWNDPAREMGFTKRVIRKVWPQTRAEANKVIEALKAMIARGYSERPEVPKCS